MFGIYIHWPFCLSKCPYCDFNSHVAREIDHARWRRALLAELEHFRAETAGRVVTSVFFGGGTPSLMEAETVAALLERIHAGWPVAADLEITLEANPGTVDRRRFADFRAAGINRVSLGMQAMADSDLRFLGRRHDVAEAQAAIALARRTFPRMSFDLIYARPGQTAQAWAAELRQAIALAADHLSLYQLTIEPGTAFHPAHVRGDFQLPDENDSAGLFEITQEITEAAGLPAYEVSNHACPGGACRHNLLYWQGGDYLGIGPGAHGRLSDGATRALRQFRVPKRWLRMVEARGHGTEEITPLAPAERVEELLLMGLRLTEGVGRDRFRAQTGLALEQAVAQENAKQLIQDGLIEWTSTHLRATGRGRPVLNALIALLIPEI